MKNIKFNKKFVQLNNQYTIILFFSAVAFLLIFLRLFFLQVINNEIKYTDIKATREVPFNYDYEDLYKRLISIEENMIQIEKILKAKN